MSGRHNNIFHYQKKQKKLFYIFHKELYEYCKLTVTNGFLVLIKYQYKMTHPSANIQISKIIQLGRFLSELLGSLMNLNSAFNVSDRDLRKSPKKQSKIF